MQALLKGPGRLPLAAQALHPGGRLDRVLRAHLRVLQGDGVVQPLPWALLQRLLRRRALQVACDSGASVLKPGSAVQPNAGILIDWRSGLHHGLVPVGLASALEAWRGGALALAASRATACLGGMPPPPTSYAAAVWFDTQHALLPDPFAAFLRDTGADVLSASDTLVSPPSWAGTADMILHRAPAAVVINKPAGVASHGGGAGQACVPDAFPWLEAQHASAFPSQAAEPDTGFRVGHRLDRAVSGAMLLPFTRAAARAFAAGLAAGQVTKVYLGITLRCPALAERVRDREGWYRVDGEQGSLTKVRVLDRVQVQGGKLATVLALQPVTGRKHQLRIACAGLSSPLWGDAKYGGGGAAGLPRGAIALHSALLAWGGGGEVGRMCITAPLPPHLARCLPDQSPTQQALQALRRQLQTTPARPAHPL